MFDGCMVMFRVDSTMGSLLGTLQSIGEIFWLKSFTTEKPKIYYRL